VKTDVLGCNNLSKILTPLIVIGLYFTVTNKIYLSAIPSAVILILLILLITDNCYSWLTKTNHPDYFFAIYKQPISFYTALFFFLSIVSVLLYFPQSLLHFSFYRYDGNFIISYAVFLFLPWYIYSGPIEKIISRFIYFSALVNLPFFIYFLFHDYIYYHHLFSATNAAGGFFTIVLALAIAHLLDKQEKLILLPIVLLAIFLFFTTSRGSMLGLIAAVLAWFCIDKPKLKWLPGVMIIGVVIIQSFLLYKYYPYYLEKISYLDYQQTRAQEYQDKKEENIYNRLINNWPKGWDGFSRSPLLGYGFGAVNDQPYPNKEKITGLFNLNHASQKVFSDAHAHHSYLHILAEQGILGLICLILLWSKIIQYLKQNRQIMWIRNGLLIASWTIIFTSFTEHRITTPAMLLPYSLLLLLYVGWNNFNQQKSQQEHL